MLANNMLFVKHRTFILSCCLLVNLYCRGKVDQLIFYGFALDME